jgi:hypothetical protein
MKRFTGLILAIALGLAACSPAPANLATPGESTLAPAGTATSAPVVNPTEATTVAAGTAVAGTAVAATNSGPSGGDVTPAAGDDFAPTPIPTLSSGLTPSELKYQLLARYPDLFFCDPDYYPVAHADEADLAAQRYPQIQKNPEEFNAIVKHLNMAIKTIQTDDEKLAVYREHKRLAAVFFEVSGDAYHYQLQTQDSDGHGFQISGLINGQGAVTAEQKQPAVVTCPICLSAGTLIDTPNGRVPVTALRVGDLVWTVNGAGARVAAPLAAVGHVPAPAGHQMVHVVLADGRELWASAGHPTADGRPLGTLRSGGVLDGARIVSAEREPYSQPATYDILPSGATGLYWANGVLLASTLR